MSTSQTSQSNRLKLTLYRYGFYLKGEFLVKLKILFIVLWSLFGIVALILTLATPGAPSGPHWFNWLCHTVLGINALLIPLPSLVTLYGIFKEKEAPTVETLFGYIWPNHPEELTFFYTSHLLGFLVGSALAYILVAIGWILFTLIAFSLLLPALCLFKLGQKMWHWRHTISAWRDTLDAKNQKFMEEHPEEAAKLFTKELHAKLPNAQNKPLKKHI